MQEIIYVNTNQKTARTDFSNAFYKVLQNLYHQSKDLIILCIGTDRVTGDSLGPIIGYKLSHQNPGATIYGTLEHPVHAKNLKATLQHIKNTHQNPLIIAIDASLGRTESIGCLTVGKGRIKPGAGVNKDLPEVGDMFITGIVNLHGIMGSASIQNTRLGVVMKMADIAHYGIVNGLNRVYNTSELFKEAL